MLNDFIFGQARAAQKAKLPTADEALPHRSQPALFNPEHFVSGHRIVDPLPENLEKAVFGLGCFGGLSAYSGSSPVFTARR